MTELLSPETQYLGCHLTYPFIFWMRILRIKDVKEVTWNHPVRTFLPMNWLCGHHHSCWGRSAAVSWSSVMCLDIFLASDLTTLFSRKELGFLFHCGWYGDIRWKGSYGRQQAAKMLPNKPLNLEEGLPGGSPVIQSDGAWVFWVVVTLMVVTLGKKYIACNVSNN